MKKLVAMFLLLAVVGVAQADVVYNGAEFKIEAIYNGQVGTDGSNDLMSFDLVATAVGGGISNVNTFVGQISGSLHQEQYNAGKTWITTPTDTSWIDDMLLADPNDATVDSMFLTHGYEVVSVTAPGEPAISAGSPSTQAPTAFPADDGCGYTSPMSGSFALGGYNEMSWTFARIVAPVGSTVTLGFYLAGNGSSDATAYGQTFEVAPEPTSMALLAFGGLAALIRRRRR